MTALIIVGALIAFVALPLAVIGIAILGTLFIHAAGIEE